MYATGSPSRAGVVAHVQQQIDEAEAELPHLRVGGAEGARALHLLEQVFGNRLAGLVVAREQVERLRAPSTSSP